MKNVVIISGSPRPQSSCKALCEAFRDGAKDAGNNVELILLRDFNLSYCKGCGACTASHRCVQRDASNDINEKIVGADVLVLATPVYFNNMTGLMKVFVDRLYPIVEDIHAETYLICTAIDPDEEHLNMVLGSMRAFTEDMLGLEEKGCITAGDIELTESIKGRSELQTAYDMGRYC